jgi:plasmid stability protein
MAINLPDDVAARLAAEAARRGQDVDELAAELLAGRLPAGPAETADGDPLAAFIGCGASGHREPFDVRQARRDLADRKLAEGA